MALAQYVDEPNNIRISRRMGVPKKVQQLSHWWKEARQTLNHPNIPEYHDVNYDITEIEVTERIIRWDIVDHEGRRTYLIIDRTQPSLG